MARGPRPASAGIVTGFGVSAAKAALAERTASGSNATEGAAGFS